MVHDKCRAAYAAQLATLAVSDILYPEGDDRPPLHVLIGARPPVATSTMPLPVRSEPRFADDAAYLDAVVAYSQVCRVAQHSLGANHAQPQLGVLGAYPAAYGAMFWNLHPNLDEASRAALETVLTDRLTHVKVLSLFAGSDERIVVVTDPAYQRRVTRAVEDVVIPLLAVSRGLSDDFVGKYGRLG